MDYAIAGSGQIEALCGEVGGLYERLKGLKDRRDRRGVRYPLAAVLMIMVSARLSGEDEARGIAEWAKWRAKPLAKALG
ncbi:MAG: transposase family protein, partial [Anaerolineae bacterium]|nr:transposase family protein [Anaerolineae bacterium]